MTDPTAKLQRESEIGHPSSKPTWSEQGETSGEQLVSKVKHLAKEGQFSRIQITEPVGDLVLEVLTSLPPPNRPSDG